MGGMAPMQGAVDVRNANYATIAAQLRFQRRPWYDLEGNLDNHYTKSQAPAPSPEDEDDEDLEIRVNELLLPSCFSPWGSSPRCTVLHSCLVRCPAMLAAWLGAASWTDRLTNKRAGGTDAHMP